jgi:hypothetical protein
MVHSQRQAVEFDLCRIFQALMPDSSMKQCCNGRMRMQAAVLSQPPVVSACTHVMHPLLLRLPT